MMSRLARKSVKVAVLPAGVAGHRRPRDLAILLYHRVGGGDREIDLDRSAFDDQLALLGAKHAVLSLDEALKDDTRGGVVVTFDDGLRDFFDTALPLLVAHGTKALLYLATGYVADGRSTVRTGEALTWSQLREAVSTGLVAVGSHTHGHVDLSRTGEEDVRNELKRSKELIEDRLGVPCRHFAYPWAVSSPVADRVVRTLFDTAALDAWRTNRRRRLDPYRLGRVPILRSDTPFFFRAKVRGMLDTEAWAYRVLGRGPWGKT